MYRTALHRCVAFTNPWVYTSLLRIATLGQRETRELVSAANLDLASCLVRPSTFVKICVFGTEIDLPV